MNKIKFVSNRPWLNKESVSVPTANVKEVPDWYREADRYVKNEEGNFQVGYDGGKMPTWKACPAILDVFSSGYVLKTPCDIDFFLDPNGRISVAVKDQDKIDFCTPRAPLPQFAHPQGYYEDHFAWWPDWAVELPEGYSALYTTPLNRFDLPFLMTSGIIDNDKVKLPGTMPFFIIKGFTGTIPAGTPYAQIFPFKREDWESEVVIEDPYQLYAKNAENAKKYRVPDGGVYKNEVWCPRKYK